MYRGLALVPPAELWAGLLGRLGVRPSRAWNRKEEWQGSYTTARVAGRSASLQVGRAVPSSPQPCFRGRNPGNFQQPLRRCEDTSPYLFRVAALGHTPSQRRRQNSSRGSRSTTKLETPVSFC